MVATQCDVFAAFLNSDVLNEVYCEQPMFRKVFGKEDHVWKLKKQLYGMKNSSLAWHNDLKATLIKPVRAVPIHVPTRQHRLPPYRTRG